MLQGQNFPQKLHHQHSGEIFVQQMRSAPSDMSFHLEHIINNDMPKQHSDFFSQLQYLPIGSIDSDGQLWATILCNPLITIMSKDTLSIECVMPQGDPFVAAVLDKNSALPFQYFAGVGIDFTNRRRNKLAGIITYSNLSSNNTLILIIKTNENMGNCPKYITMRSLQYCQRIPSEPIITTRLTAESLLLLNQASTSFMTTIHIDSLQSDENDIGFNHRGGPPGFIRHYGENHQDYLILPDYSGNQFYQSLGNIETDHKIGLVVPNFHTGDLLFITGQAYNYYNEEANQIMPRTSLITKITVQKVILLKQAMNLELIGKENYSPYNPPLKLLAIETPAMQFNQHQTVASLIAIQKESKFISTFRFELSSPIESNFLPGCYGIFDFSKLIRKEYQHMNHANPRSVNDDLIRTWTISSISNDHWEISVTIKKAGAISSLLHAVDVYALNMTDKGGSSSFHSIQVSLMGIGGEFSCFASPYRALDNTTEVFKGAATKEEGVSTVISRRMLWIAGGVGVTPFLAMNEGICRQQQSNPSVISEIHLFFSCRDDEIELLKYFHPDVHIHVFITRGFDRNQNTILKIQESFRHPWNINDRRMTSGDFDDFIAPLRANNDETHHDMIAYLCGPSPFMDSTKEWLESILPPERIKMEAFNF
jgi:ferredoxin-NADP reductase